MPSNNQPNSNASFLSIDEWQDAEPMTGSWFDNPLVGSVGVVLAVSVLLSLSLMSSQADANRREQARAEAEATIKYVQSPGFVDGTYESESFDQALQGLSWSEKGPSLNYFANQANFDPGKKPLVQKEILKLLATHCQELELNMGIFSVWFDFEDHRRISPLIEKSPGHEWLVVEALANLPNPVPILISEMSQHSPNSHIYTIIQNALRQNQSVTTEEILRQLANKLRSSNSPQEFERIVWAINDLVWQIGDKPELKKQIAGAMALAGQQLMPEQLEKMDANATAGITKFSEFPEMADLITKLQATSHGASNFQMSFGSKQKEQTAESALKLARDNKLHPRELLRYSDSESVQEFLWAGRLRGESQFLNLNLSTNATSMKGFSNAGVWLMRSKKYAAIDLIHAVVEERSKEFTRERMSDKFLEQLDILLANKLKVDLDPPSGTSTEEAETYQREMNACLTLAERLGGKSAALAITQVGKGKPELLREFKGMLAALIALNEPETYDMIVNAWLIHPDIYSLDDIGKAIEPTFINRLQVRFEKLNPAVKSQCRAIHILTGALAQIGTSKSVPVLAQVKTSKVVGIQKAGERALMMIRER